MLKIIFLNFLNFLTNVCEFWLILDRSHRTLIWKVRMIRSLDDRTFQLRSATPTTAPSMSPTPQPTRRTLCWEVRYRSLLWFFSRMIKLYRVRPLLYRRKNFTRKCSLELAICSKRRLRKGTWESSRRDLHNALPCTALESNPTPLHRFWIESPKTWKNLERKVPGQDNIWKRWPEEARSSRELLNTPAWRVAAEKKATRKDIPKLNSSSKIDNCFA